MPRSQSSNDSTTRSKVKTNGRTHWSVTVTTVDANDDLDHDFWQRLSPDARVALVADCLLDCEKTKGRDALPRFRRVYRVLERASGAVSDVVLAASPVRIDILTSISGVESFAAAWKRRVDGRFGRTPANYAASTTSESVCAPAGSALKSPRKRTRVNPAPPSNPRSSWG
jgi:hypothetical protein